MSLYSYMAWRNIWRNPRRSLLTMGAIAFATVILIFMLSLQFGNYSTIIDSVVKMRTGHLQVQATGYQENRDIHLAVADPSQVAATLDRAPEVSGFTFRAHAFALVSADNRSYGTVVTGISDRELTTSSLARTISEGRFLTEDEGAQALVGNILAKNLRVKPGDEVALLGQGLDGSVAATIVTVRGILSSGQDQFDRVSFYIPLPYFQELFGMGEAVHEIVVVAERLEDVAGLKQRLEEEVAGNTGRALRVLDWKELSPGLLEAITLDLMTGFLFYIVLIVVVAFSISNTFIMAIFERKKELGLMLALGSRPARLTGILSLEYGMLTTLGLAAGILIGCLVTLYFGAYGIQIPGMAEMARHYGVPERVFPQLSFLSVGIGSGLVVGISLCTSLIPVWKVRRLRPVPAMAEG